MMSNAKIVAVLAASVCLLFLTLPAYAHRIPLAKVVRQQECLLAKSAVSALPVFGNSIVFTASNGDKFYATADIDGRIALLKAQVETVLAEGPNSKLRARTIAILSTITPAQRWRINGEKEYKYYHSVDLMNKLQGATARLDELLIDYCGEDKEE